MSGKWKSPVYKLAGPTGKQIIVDVTSSVSPGLPPHQVLKDKIVPWLRERGVQSVLDFGAGALRHTFPLLRAGFEVCAVEFEQTFTRPVCAEARVRAERNSNFSSLIWPDQFLGTKRRFDAALLCYVLQIMPKEGERRLALKEIARRLRGEGYLLYMSRFGQVSTEDSKHRVEDGYYRWPEREEHSFYREFTAEETADLFDREGFTRLRNLSQRGTEQVHFYTRGKGSWI